MKRILVLFFLIAPALLRAQTVDLSPAALHRVDSVLAKYFSGSGGGGVVLLAQQGSPVFKKAYGVANEELHVPMNTDHRLGIGSVSKQFAAVCLLMLQQDGKLNYRDDIRKYLPAYNTYGKTITIEHILSHTSGIPSYTEMYGFDTLAARPVSVHQLVKFFERQPLLFEPGSDWSYSNSGYVLAALIVEKVSGQPFNDFLQKRIFEPLRMSNTFLGTSNFTLENKTGEYGANLPKGKVKMEPQYDWYWAYGAGQIVSTVDDMLKWDEALQQEKLLRKDLLAIAHKSFQLTTGTPANYGLGWSVSTLGTKAFVQHGGAIGGYRAQAARVPDDRLYWVLLSNSGTVNSALISNRVFSELYTTPPLKEAKPATIPEGIAGVYESLNAGSRLQVNYGKRSTFFTIRVDSGRVFTWRTGGGKTELIPAGADLLFVKGSPYQRWKVERDAGGTVVGIRVSALFGASGPERFNKRAATPIPALPKPALVPQAELAAWTGTYAHEFGDRLIVTVVKDQLKLSDPVTGDETFIKPLDKSRFFEADFDREYVFRSDPKKGSTEFRFFNGAYEMVFRRVTELY
jgi:CubicO group peptidase (beta-lactamase class C family)